MTVLETILSLLHVGKPAPAPVDIPRRLDGLAAARPDHPDWRHSVVDLLKVLDLDSGEDNRYRLAIELGYPGPMGVDDNSAMNEWLRKTVMQRVADNGGAVPAELL